MGSVVVLIVLGLVLGSMLLTRQAEKPEDVAEMPALEKPALEEPALEEAAEDVTWSFEGMSIRLY